MAKIYMKRLADRYGLDQNNVTSGEYRRIMQEILARNSESISKATAKLTDDHWKKSNAKMKPDKRFIIPDISEVLPGKDVHIRKAVEQGTLITTTLREELSKNLRGVLDEFRTAKTEEQAFIRRRGAKAGTINPKLIDLFQQRITETFQSYTKKDPRFGVPANIRTIAVTEARSAINDIKGTYMKYLTEKNPHVIIKKRWRQNKELAKKPRKGHSIVNGTTVKVDEKFLVPLFKKKNGREVRIGTTPMDRPHDSTAPLEQIIGCNCDIEYIVESV